MSKPCDDKCVKMVVLIMSSRGSVGAALARCSGGYEFDSCRGLRFLSLSHTLKTHRNQLRNMWNVYIDFYFILLIFINSKLHTFFINKHNSHKQTDTVHHISTYTIHSSS